MLDVLVDFLTFARLRGRVVAPVRAPVPALAHRARAIGTRPRWTTRLDGGRSGYRHPRTRAALRRGEPSPEQDASDARSSRRSADVPAARGGGFQWTGGMVTSCASRRVFHAERDGVSVCLVQAMSIQGRQVAIVVERFGVARDEIGFMVEGARESVRAAAHGPREGLRLPRRDSASYEFFWSPPKFRAR